jgi:hypothetical protein
MNAKENEIAATLTYAGSSMKDGGVPSETQNLLSHPICTGPFNKDTLEES